MTSLADIANAYEIVENSIPRSQGRQSFTINLYFYVVMCIFLPCFFRYHASNSLGGHSGQFSLHLLVSHQGNRGFSLSMTKPLDIRFYHCGCWDE